MFSVGLIFAFGLSALIVVGGSFVFLGGANDRTGFVNASLLGPTSSGFGR